MITMKHIVACMGIALIAIVGGNATAEIYSCKLKGGRVEVRDFPCDLAARPTAPPHSVTAKPERTPYPPPSNVKALKAGFDNFEQYQAARRICVGLLSQYDTLKPMKRCSTDDSNCLSRADDEISALSRQMTAHPEWKRQQCDLVIQMESTATDKAQNTFEVVATIQGCKYFVVEQGASYSLVEEWLCFRPSRGDFGEGDISTYGIKNVKLNGLACTLYVDDWLLRRSRSAEKLRAKCQ